jgi:CRP-like cAMP-binding protein
MSGKTSINHFIHHLSMDDARLIEPHLTPVEFAAGLIVHPDGKTSDRIIFPNGGLAAEIVSFVDGQSIATGLVGRNGIIGLSAAFDRATECHQTIALVPITGTGIDGSALRNIADRDMNIWTTLRRWHRMALTAARQSAACNAVHPLERRLCRLLARALDILESDTLPLTHESLSQMLGVRRSSLTLTALNLQRLEIIRYQRGRITVIDHGRLRQSACECYHTLTKQYEQLIGWRPEDGRNAATHAVQEVSRFSA